MMMNFYVQGKPSGSSSAPNKDSSESYLDAAVHWTRDKASLVSQLTMDEVIEWTKDQASNAWQRSKRTFRYLSGAPLPPMSLPENSVVDVDVPKKTESGGWNFFGIFSTLRGKRAGLTEVNVKRADGDKWTDGEVHADLIMVCSFFLLIGLNTDLSAIEPRWLF